MPISKFAIALNSRLKKTIVIKQAQEVDEEFHARFSCKKKTYEYRIDNTPYGSAIFRNLACHIPQKLDVTRMQQAVKYFIGEHDFKAFKASGTSSKSSIRTIYHAEVMEEEGNIKIRLTGNGFLYNMVRIISGTLVDVGLHKIAPTDIPNIIEQKDRTKAGKTMPAHGLYLMSVEYNEGD